MRKGFFARLAVQNIRKNRKVYYPYILTAVLTVAMLYIITSLSRNVGVKSATVSFTLGLGVWVTTIFSVIFLFYTNSFLMKRRKKEFGLYNILGMEKKHIGRVVALEALYILVFSLLLGFAVGMLLDKLMYMLLLKMVGSAADMSFYVSGYAITFTTIVISATFLLIFLNSLRQIHLAKPIELLRGGQVGEREPKAKWVLAVLGIATLGLGYYISATVSNPVAAILLFFVAVVLVILGTYMLYTAGSISLLKLMRKNKRYYYQADHFINVSSMMYRMKQNAVGLGNICILSTMVLVMLFSTVALWFGIDEMAGIRCPTDISFSILEPDKGDELAALVENEVNAAGVTASNVQRYRYLQFAGYKQGAAYLTEPDRDEVDLMGDNITDLFMVPLDDFNALGGTSETLEADEILLGYTDKEHPEDTLSVCGKTFRVKGRFKGGVQNGMVNANIYNTQYVIVKDMDVFNAIDEQQRADYGKNASSPRSYIGFDVNCSDDDQRALYRTLDDKVHETFGPRYSDCKADMRDELLQLYGGLFFIGLFLGFLFTMAMILIMYYKQISEGYDDQERYHIMRKVGMSRAEVKRSIRSQILTVFFLPLVTAGVHVAFSFPSISRMFRALGLMNVQLEAWSAVGSFAFFAVLYCGLYALTAKVYYRIVSAR